MSDVTLRFPSFLHYASYSGVTKEQPEVTFSNGSSVGTSDFDVIVPSPETIEAIVQTESGEDMTCFATAEELFEDLGVQRTNLLLHPVSSQTSRSTRARRTGLSGLMRGEQLPEGNHHKLKGGDVGCCECRIRPDILLIHDLDEEKMRISLVRIGSNSDLFSKRRP